MADGDSSLNDDDQEFLLSGSEDLGESVDFDAASGIDVGNLGRTVVGTLGLALGTAAATLVTGVAEAWTSLIDSLAGFIGGTRELLLERSLRAREPVYEDVPGLIGRLAESVATPMRAAWNSAIPDTGIAAWFTALALVLITFYVAARGFEVVSEVLNR